MEFVDVFQDSIEDRTKNFVTKEYLDVRLMELELKLSLKSQQLKTSSSFECLPFGWVNLPQCLVFYTYF